MLKDLKTFKKMLFFVSSYKWVYIISLFGEGVCSALRGGLFSILYKNTFDEGFTKNTTMVLLVISLCLVSLLQRVFSFLFKKWNRHISGDIRMRVFEKLVKLPLSEFETKDSSTILACLNNHVSALEEVYSSKMSSLFNTMITGSISLIIIFILDYRLAVISLAFNIIATFINLRFIPLLKRNSRGYLESMDKLLRNISTIIHGIKEIKVFGIDKEIYSKFSDVNFYNGKTILTNAKIKGVINGLQLLLQTLSFSGVLLGGLFLLFQGKITIGTVIAIILQQDGVAFMFMNLSNYINNLQKVFLGAEKVFEFFSLKEECESGPLGGKWS